MMRVYFRTIDFGRGSFCLPNSWGDFFGEGIKGSVWGTGISEREFEEKIGDKMVVEGLDSGKDSDRWI